MTAEFNPDYPLNGAGCILSSRTDVLVNAFQKRATEKIKTKWENIYTTLPEGDSGSASLSLPVPRRYRTTSEETRKRLEKIQQERQKNNTDKKKASVTHLH